jgi:hypothetical protein
MQNSAPSFSGDETKTTILAAIPVVIATSTSVSAPLATGIVAHTLVLAPSTTGREPAPVTLRHGTGNARCWTGQTATDFGRDVKSWPSLPWIGNPGLRAGPHKGRLPPPADEMCVMAWAHAPGSRPTPNPKPRRGGSGSRLGAFSELSQNSTSALSRLCRLAPATVRSTRKGQGRPPVPVDAPPEGGCRCPPHRS